MYKNKYLGTSLGTAVNLFICGIIQSCGSSPCHACDCKTTGLSISEATVLWGYFYAKESLELHKMLGNTEPFSEWQFCGWEPLVEKYN